LIAPARKGWQQPGKGALDQLADGVLLGDDGLQIAEPSTIERADIT
jgi:hypothetical protein